MAERFIFVNTSKKQSRPNANKKVTSVCIVVDISQSMYRKEGQEEKKSRMEYLNEGLNLLIEKLRGYETQTATTRVAIVTFGNEAKILQDFKDLDKIQKISIQPKQECGNIPAGVEMALDIIEKEKKYLEENRIRRARRKWLVIMSDGTESAPKDKIPKAVLTKNKENMQRKTSEMYADNALEVIPVLTRVDTTSNAYKDATKTLYGFKAGPESRSSKVSHEHAQKNIVNIGAGKEEFNTFFDKLSYSVSSGTTTVFFGKDAQLKEKFRQLRAQNSMEQSEAKEQDSKEELILEDALDKSESQEDYIVKAVEIEEFVELEKTEEKSPLSEEESSAEENESESDGDEDVGNIFSSNDQQDLALDAIIKPLPSNGDPENWDEI